jgi:hypothetical protein
MMVHADGVYGGCVGVCSGEADLLFSYTFFSTNASSVPTFLLLFAR